MSILKATFAAELRRVLNEHKVTVSDAAKGLGISRQALYNYLNEISTPRVRVLARAMELWGLELRIGQQVFSSESLHSGPAGPVEVPKPPVQLDLWKQLDAIKHEDLQIGVKRIGKTLRVSVSIAIPA
jgi:transcriptional regulator with XRE-family HTH domain